MFIGDISIVNGIINQLITWGAPPCSTSKAKSYPLSSGDGLAVQQSHLIHEFGSRWRRELSSCSIKKLTMGIEPTIMIIWDIKMDQHVFFIWAMLKYVTNDAAVFVDVQP